MGEYFWYIDENLEDEIEQFGKRKDILKKIKKILKKA